MKKVLSKTTCDECGEEFDGEFIQHDTIDDDFDWEHAGIHIISPQEYPHLHEQPTVTCHYCPSCNAKNGLEAKK